MSQPKFRFTGRAAEREVRPHLSHYERLTHLATGVTPDQLLNHSHFLQADVYERLTHMATQAGAGGQFLTQANLA